ncbi:MAG: capsule assembly Wzi family protein [Christiangramia sp.]|uniref:Uncharacterized protein n=1 Tax=Christiangramia flava JLT2011 TaxID=1229726 RepID=A0A1L7I0S1_9FLAO|nr:capsule assembly Wzi family protein [Christiangramia flava]APU66793.1 hypothetical protein GRFL_0069 [Christiangramia flava JLT2011]OSS38430.1 hypothetical protein C723_2667 [Christiangramia flava JLT2011]
MRRLFPLFILLHSFCLFSQTEYSAEFSGVGLASSNGEMPFWFYSNTKGRIDQKTNLMGLFSGKGTFDTSDESFVEMGAGAFFSEGYDNNLKLDEAYIAFTSPKIGVVVGKKHKKDLFRGLSASNESILWSLNAGAIPGIRLFTTDPFFISGKDHGFGVTGSWEEYLLDDDRYVENTRLHHKSFHFVYRSQTEFQVSVGLQHFVQWGGVSPDFGKLPSSFQDYTKIITGGTGEDSVGGQEVNALGNQLGSYELKVRAKIQNLDFQFLYNHIFEDGSGLKMGNLPDGRYSLYVEDNRDSFWGVPWFKAFILEYYYLENQSRNRQGSSVDGSDNYFSNNLYRSGWTYNNFTIGNPFIIANTPQGIGIKYNIVSAIHMGITGEILNDQPYKLLLSYRSIYGKKDSFIADPKKIISPFFELALLQGDYQLNLQLGADINSGESSNFGVGLSFRQEFF